MPFCCLRGWRPLTRKRCLLFRCLLLLSLFGLFPLVSSSRDTPTLPRKGRKDAREIFFSFVPFNHPDAEIIPLLLFPRRENTMRARGAHMSGIILLRRPSRARPPVPTRSRRPREIVCGIAPQIARLKRVPNPNEGRN